MITKELQQLSDKLTGGHTSAHEISKQVDYIEKNYEGGGGSVLMVELEESGVVVTFKKTWKEIHDAFISGATILLHRPDTQWFDEQYSTVSDISHYAPEGRYDVAAVFSGQRQGFSTNDENGYPEYRRIV